MVFHKMPSVTGLFPPGMMMMPVASSVAFFNKRPFLRMNLKNLLRGRITRLGEPGKSGCEEDKGE
jgi:hypothetical protein